MKKMKTITVNGSTYTVEDPCAVSFEEAQELPEEKKKLARDNVGAASIDDSKVGDAAWSSKNTVDKLCPSFAESGSVVSCEPVEGYPLEVVSNITPDQSGSGDPSIENIRPIEGHDTIMLTRDNGVQIDDYVRDFDQTVYGGSLNWNTGELVSNMELITFTGDENWEALSHANGVVNYVYLSIGQYGYVDTKATEICSHFKTVAISSSNQNIGMYITNSSGYNDARILVRMNSAFTFSEWIAFLKEQYARGTPLQACFGVSAPKTAQLTPQEIIAMGGTNTLYSNTGDTQVKGRANPGAIIEKLTNAILSLGGNV